MHRNAKLTPLGRVEMIRQLEDTGCSARAVATARGVHEKTVRKWRRRAQEEGSDFRLLDRSSRPRRQPRHTTAKLEAKIVALRRRYLTYSQITGLLPVSRATLSRVLRRHHLNRLEYLQPVAAVVRYERAKPGELLHLDIKKLGRFRRPGVRGTGNRADRSEGAGVQSVHVAIDDHTRLGFACVHTDEKIPCVIAALRTSLRFFAHHGIKVKSILTDNGSSYRSKLFATACQKLRLKHLFTRPYRPQTNGKAERFIQTLTREWAYGCCFKNSDQRTHYLPYYLHDYNWHRPHTSLNRLPPTSRLPLTADNLLSLHS
jgi:transposase InsO family protein